MEKEIMARWQVSGVERQGAFEQHGKTYMAVTDQARVWCAACNVFLVKEINHVFLEFLLNVYKIKGNVELTRNASRIIDRLEGAAFILHHAFNAIVFDHARF